MKTIVGVLVLALGLDQLVKLLVIKTMQVYDSITIIPNFFHFTYVRNDGAAWSILSGNRLLLICISLSVLAFLYLFFIKDKKLKRIEQISYGLLIGGIIGNLCDRIRLGVVIDYFDFTLFGYPFPVFNIADICIVVSIILLVIVTLKEDVTWKK